MKVGVIMVQIEKLDEEIKKYRLKNSEVSSELNKCEKEVRDMELRLKDKRAYVDSVRDLKDRVHAELREKEKEYYRLKDIEIVEEADGERL